MKPFNHFIVLATILIGFWLDGVISLLTIPYLVETCIGFLIFSYWVFALPEKLHSSSAFLYGLIIDLLFGEALGLNMMFFIGMSYVIHVYVFRFRLFSYFQLTIFFAGASTFYLACKYLIFFPVNYSYLVLVLSFLTNAIVWLVVYFLMRFFRRKAF